MKSQKFFNPHNSPDIIFPMARIESILLMSLLTSLRHITSIVIAGIYNKDTSFQYFCYEMTFSWYDYDSI